ncbi:DUF7691 family protein [Nocardia fusca]|uniref:DUF7691 family protein n=1 Tax=Nocardia fusca TaxID=941183 RepID=UPI0007A75FCB|nr:hypothetical protein [Nocardia fusca]
MGYGVMVYAVEIEMVRAPSKYLADPQDYFARMMNLRRPTDTPEGFDEALAELFFSRPFTGDEGSVYGYALEWLCERFGSPLKNAHWYPVGLSWLDTVRRALGEVGVQFDPSDLVYSRSPVLLPDIVDFPGIGHLTNVEVKPLAQVLGAADLSAVADRQIRESIAEMQGWIQYCAKINSDLVGFFH